MGLVTSASFSSDGTRIITASDDSKARVWREAADGTWSATSLLEGHRGSVTSASFAPDGTHIITASDDRTTLVWQEAADGTWSATSLKVNWGSITSASFSPNGTRIVTAFSGGTARVWREGADGIWSVTSLLKGHGDSVNSASFSPEGTRIVTASDDGTARVWDVAWLIGDEGRAWANAHSPRFHLKPLIEAACAEKLVGTERTMLNRDGEEIGRESVRRLTEADTDTAPILRGREGEDVCAWRPSILDWLLTWALRDAWR
jgi:dipeptidyl aminopeptidase/acylaminoacyl peptidase